VPARARQNSGSIGDFNVFLHGLRSRELAQLPGGARTVLHGGAAGKWYFEWFDDCYPTTVEKHIAVDAFATRPDGLDERVDWLERSLGDLGPVGAGEVDLVFAGQVIEHLWPDEVVGFLCDAHRVLRQGGVLALDSPNREVTKALDWNHPEHTVEFSVDEILDALRLAGFGGARVRGLWLCRDSENGRVLPLEAIEDGGPWPWRRRRDVGEERPDDAFVWWVEAKRAEMQPDREALTARVDAIYADYRRHRLSRFQHEVGNVHEEAGRRVVRAPKRAKGHVLFGPFVPMPPGRWEARFRLAATARWIDRVSSEEAVASVDVTRVIDITSGLDSEIIAQRDLTVLDLPPDGSWVDISLPFDLDATAFGVQFRARTLGRVRLAAELEVAVERLQQVEELLLLES
jgi:SAM-dependent methyltransferase